MPRTFLELSEKHKERYQAIRRDRNNQLAAIAAFCFNSSIESKQAKGNATMFTLMTQEHETSIQEFRTIESVAFAHKMGENGGFYKVQLIDENGVIVSEWK